MTDEDKTVVAPFGAALASAYQPPEPLTRDGALAIVRALLGDDRLDSRETEALEALLAASDPAHLPRLLAPGEEIPPGCTASLRAAIVSGPAAPVTVVDEARGRAYHLPAAVSRAFSPHGRTSAEIEVAAGVAARELCAEHEPGAGAVVDVRLVRRGEQAPRPVQGRWDGQRVVFDETPEVRAARERRDALREKFNSYDGGDRPMSPPVRLIRELDEAEAELRRLRGGA